MQQSYCGHCSLTSRLRAESPQPADSTKKAKPSTGEPDTGIVYQRFADKHRGADGRWRFTGFFTSTPQINREPVPCRGRRTILANKTGFLDEITQGDDHGALRSVGYHCQGNSPADSFAPDLLTHVRQDQLVCRDAVNGENRFASFNARIIGGTACYDVNDLEVLRVLSHPHSGAIIGVAPPVALVLFENNAIARVIYNQIELREHIGADEP